MKLIAVAMTVLATSFAFAKDGGKGWMFDPYAGYSMGTLTTKVGAAAAQTINTTEIPVGIIASYSWGNFYMGLDAAMGMSGTAKSTTAGAPTDKIERTTASLLFGYNWGRFHATAEYLGYNSMKYTANGATVSTTFTGAGYGVGIGYQLMNHLSVELVYDVHTYTNYSISSGGSGTVSSIYSQFDDTSYGLNLAFPFSF